MNKLLNKKSFNKEEIITFLKNNFNLPVIICSKIYNGFIRKKYDCYEYTRRKF